jgi:hypothetical protein
MQEKLKKSQLILNIKFIRLLATSKKPHTYTHTHIHTHTHTHKRDCEDDNKMIEAKSYKTTITHLLQPHKP